MPEIDIVPWRGTQVIVVHTHLSSGRPHHLVKAGPVDGVYVRIGSTNRRADPALISEMQRSARHAAFDETPVAELSASAIDVPAAAAAFAPVRSVQVRHLASLGLLTDHQGRQVPTAGGVLLFGRDRRATFPDAWLQLGAFGGTDRSRILDQREFGGPLPGWVDEAVAFVDRATARAAVIDGTRRRDVPTIPPVAVREWGSGIGRMTTACTDAGLPAPDFVELAGRFRVVLPTERTSVSAVSGDDRTLLDLLGDRGRSTAELAAELGRSTRTVRTRLARLVDRGLVVEIGSSPHDPHRRYHRSAGSSA